MGSGGSALSLGFAAGLAAAGGFGATAVPAFVIGGAGVLPSTGSAIFPLLDLSIIIINRDDRQTKFPETVFRYNFLYFRNPLRVKAKSGFSALLSPWFFFWTAGCTVSRVEAARLTPVSADTIHSKKISTQRARRTQRKPRNTIRSPAVCLPWFFLSVLMCMCRNPLRLAACPHSLLGGVTQGTENDVSERGNECR